MVTKLLAGGGKYDLIQPSEYTVEALIRENQLAPINQAALSNLANISSEFRSMPFDVGNKFSVPYMAGFVGICVNTAKIKTPIHGFAEVFTPENKGRIVVLDDAREITSWAFAADKLGINDVTPENLEKVKPLLKKWLPLVKVYDSDSPKTSLKNGDVDVGVIWSGEAALLYRDDKKFSFTLPAEGSHLFVDNLAIPKTAAHPRTPTSSSITSSVPKSAAKFRRPSLTTIRTARPALCFLPRKSPIRPAIPRHRKSCACRPFAIWASRRRPSTN